MAPPLVKTFTLDWARLPRDSSPLLAIGQNRISMDWTLLNTNAEGCRRPRLVVVLSKIMGTDPSPPPTPKGYPVFYIKNYTENHGILESLEACGIVRRNGELYVQGSVVFPKVELLIRERRQLQMCANELCQRWEDIRGDRYKRCGRCKRVYYCSEEV